MGVQCPFDLPRGWNSRPRGIGRRAPRMRVAKCWGAPGWAAGGEDVAWAADRRTAPTPRPRAAEHWRSRVAERRGYELLTFDCYGTLIDWAAGIRRAVEGVAAESGVPVDAGELYRAHARIEAEAQQPPWRGYREVLTEVLVGLGRELGFAAPAARRPALAESVPSWPAFPDTNPALVRLKRRFRLGILSNIDRDLLRRTMEHFEVAFDVVVTAEDVRSYKPGHAHFERLRELERPAAGAWLHVAQSLFHDVMPAGELGIPCVWINRRGETNDSGAAPLAEFPDLSALADWLGA